MASRPRPAPPAPASDHPYLDFSALTAALEALAAQHPNLIALESVGESHEGRPLWLVCLSDRAGGEAQDKPALWLDANTHAAELAGSAVVLHTIQELARRHAAGDGVAQALLAGRAIYAMPRVNPDGAEFVLRTGAPLRAGTRFWPSDPDEVQGLDPADVDGDGRVLQMRRRSPTGAFKPWSADPRLLVPRQPGDHEGPFYDLYREGLFTGDFDAARPVVPPPRRGTDFNRNYPYGFRPEFAQKGAGPYPLSEPETAAHLRAVLARPRVSVALSYHTYCGALLRPFSDKPDREMDPHDLAVFEAVGARGTELLGYPCVGVYRDFRYSDLDVISGAFDDWAYNDRGLLAYTVEIWNIAAAAGLKIRDLVGFYFRGRRRPEQTAQIFDWVQERCPRGWVDWYPFEHPQLGPVELGGFDRVHSWQNPPRAELERECARHLAFVEALLWSLPRLRVASLEVQDESGAHGSGRTMRRVRAVVENTGYLSSAGTRHGEQMAPRVAARLELGDGQRLVAGERGVDLGVLSGVGDVTLRPFADPVFFSGATSTHVGVAEWLVEGDGPIQVRVDGGRAGVVHAAS